MPILLRLILRARKLLGLGVFQVSEMMQCGEICAYNGKKNTHSAFRECIQSRLF